jgi:hypothetical protein
VVEGGGGGGGGGVWWGEEGGQRVTAACVWQVYSTKKTWGNTTGFCKRRDSFKQRRKGLIFWTQAIHCRPPEVEKV